jgi:hypothetical protein
MDERNDLWTLKIKTKVARGLVQQARVAIGLTQPVIEVPIFV